MGLGAEHCQRFVHHRIPRYDLWPDNGWIGEQLHTEKDPTPYYHRSHISEYFILDLRSRRGRFKHTWYLRPRDVWLFT